MNYVEEPSRCCWPCFPWFALFLVYKSYILTYNFSCLYLTFIRCVCTDEVCVGYIENFGKYMSKLLFSPLCGQMTMPCAWVYFPCSTDSDYNNRTVWTLTEYFLLFPAIHIPRMNWVITWRFLVRKCLSFCF